MIKKKLFKTMTLIVLCTMVFAGCGKKKVTVDTSITSTESESTTETKRVAADQEQVTVSVKDADGNTVEVAGVVETKENGEKVVIVTDSDGNKKEISADNFSQESTVVTNTNEEVSEEISSSATPEDSKEDNKKDEEILPTISAGNTTSNPTQTAHEHSWNPVYKTVHHDAVTESEQVWVVDKPAWDEPEYKVVYVCLQCENNKCPYCIEHGTQLAETYSFEESYDHIYNCAINYGICDNTTTRKKIIGTIHHDEEGHYETSTVTKQEAYDEQVIDHYECTCGATK